MSDGARSRILTLVFTDLADSTRLKTQLGDQRVSELIARHRTLVSSLSIAATGRVIDWAGDGAFLTFETPSAAVTFALQLQQAHAEHPDLPGVRTGIRMGEVSERPGPDGDPAHPRVEGLAVDLAARICSLAKRGQVLMSAGVADSVRQRLETTGYSRPILWRTHGAYSLKGFDKTLEVCEAGLEGVASFLAPEGGIKTTEPRRAHSAGRRGWLATAASFLLAGIAGAGTFWWTSRHQPDSSPADVAQVRTSIAVLPFVNMSPDADNEYFSDGITEDLITALSKVYGLKVASRTSSFAFKGKNEDITEIGEQLQVDAVLEGSVAKAGERVRITAQLINVEDGYHLWSEAYDRELQDVFAVRSEVAETVANALRINLAPAEHRTLAQKPTDNLEAYQLYLKARYALNSLDDWKATRGYLERAIALDPAYALAYLGLAEYYIWSADWGHPAIEALPRARAAAQKALALDPTLASAHTYLGMVHFWYDHDVDAALQAFETARTLQPDLAGTMLWFGYVLVCIGRTDDGIAMLRSGYQIGPLEPNITENLGGALILAGRYEEAIEQLRAATSVTGENWVAHQALGWAYARTGQFPEAIASARKALELSQNHAEPWGWLGRIYAEAGKTAEAEEVLSQLLERQDIYVLPTTLATILIDLGRYDEALEQLAKGVEQRSYAVMTMKVDDAFDPLRADPRFTALLKRVGLE